jgi:hypothetical protein
VKNDFTVPLPGIIKMEGLGHYHGWIDQIPGAGEMRREENRGSPMTFASFPISTITIS